jgi:DNA end-binding protein Ku
MRKSAFFGDVSAEKTDPELLEVAKALIEKKTKKFDPGAFEDHYTEALRELIERKMKMKGAKITAEEEEPRRPSGENVIDLMAALKRSLEGKEPAPSKRAGERRKTTARKAPARKTAKKKAPARKKAS